jgi:hypothetical protein
MNPQRDLFENMRAALWIIVVLLALILLTGCSPSSPAGIFACHEETRETLQDEHDAYRLCMQSAGSTGCRMTPQDFVRYYEIKRILESDDGNPQDTSGTLDPPD